MFEWCENVFSRNSSVGIETISCYVYGVDGCSCGFSVERLDHLVPSP